MNRRLAALVTLLLGLLLAGASKAQDTVYYYSSDTLHSEVVITDASRNVVERTHYAPYGQVLNRTMRDGSGYTGHEEDPESSLVYMQQRYYDPESGRFLSSDPVATTDDGGSFNRYAYVGNDPMDKTDPSGEEGVGGGWLNETIAMGNSDNGPLSASDAAQAGEFIGGFIPGISEGLATKNFLDNPSWLNAGILVLSAADLGSVTKAFAKGLMAERAATSAATIDTSLVRFTQSSVSQTFRTGQNINDVAAALQGSGGDALAKAFKPIRIFERDGNLFTLDNRRLLTFSMAGREVPAVWATPEEIAAQSWKFTATPEQLGGWFIRVGPK